MKRPYEIQFIKTSEQLRWMILEDAWSLRADFRWKWMRRFALWVIQKIGVNARHPVVEVERMLVDPPTIMEKLFAQHRALLQMDREPKRLLIGAEDFAELMRQPEMRHHFTIDCEYMKGGRGGHRVIGLAVEVVPWMRGLLVMP